MPNEEVFSKGGFDSSIRAVFNRIASFVEAKDGCDAYIYNPPKMKQARAAHHLPGIAQKKAKGVFLIMEPRRRGILISTRGRFTGWRPKSETSILIDPNFSNWSNLESLLKQWSSHAKEARKAPIERDFGDGVALPGGLPETNRAKF